MSNFSVLCVLSVIVAVIAATPQGKYTTKYDNIDLDQVLGNERLLTNYLKCLLDQGPCAADGEELKKNLKDALETGCKKCSEKQKEGTDKVFRDLIKNHPKEFETLEKKYDPKGTYKARYEAEAKKKGINL